MSQHDLPQGDVFTRTIVVNFMLDLIGYTADAKLTSFRVLEPSFGKGDFLIPIIKRLLEAFAKLPVQTNVVATLGNCIRSVELHEQTYQNTKKHITSLLSNHGFTKDNASKLTNLWLKQGDFLMSTFDTSFTHIVGNPPYVRQERLSKTLVQTYRAKFKTIYGRADLYIPFIEHALSLLATSGQLCFICPNRWLKNHYGKNLRKLVADNYHLKYYIDMVDTAAFQTKVMAYTGIMTFTKNLEKRLFPTEEKLASTKQDSKKPSLKTKNELLTFFVKRPTLNVDNLNLLAQQLNNSDTIQYYQSDLGQKQIGTKKIETVTKVAKSACAYDPWLIDCAAQLELIRKLEHRFPLLEQAGCKVGIGVATGNDKVFIKNYHDLDIEEDRKLPLAMTKDIVAGNFKWGGKGIINTFTLEGKIINLNEYPKLASYLEANKPELFARHVARKNPAHWYRTVGLIHSKLVNKPKLLIPDIRAAPTVALEQGAVYPHHNLYWVTSESWELCALRNVLQSNVVKLFVWAYSVKMRGDWLRFQAQTLRRIVIPFWADIPPHFKQQLASSHLEAAELHDQVYELFKLSENDIKIIEEIS